MLSGGRVHLGGGNALQKKFGIKDSPEQIFADWTTHRRGDGRYNDRDLVRAFADECVPTFQFLLDNGVTFIEKPIVTPDASTVPRVFVTHEWHIPGEVIAPRRNRNGSGLVRRLAESARQKGVQILLKHEMREIVRDRAQGPRDRHRRAGGRQGRRHRGQAGHRHRDRRTHRQRQFPQDVRSPPHRGVPAGRPALLVPGRRRRDRRHGHRRVAVGDRHADRRSRPRHHQDASCRNAVGLSQPLLRDRQSHLSSLQGDRADGDGLAGGDPGEPVRPAVLERARQLLRLHQRGARQPRRQRQAQRRRSGVGDLRRGRGGAAEMEARSRRMSIPTAISSAPTRSTSWPARSATLTRSSRCPARRCRRR